jgi:glycerate-2-kinase
VTPPVDPRANLQTIFRSAIDSVDAHDAVDRCLLVDHSGVFVCDRELAQGAKLLVIAIGKAAAPMAAAVAARVPHERIRAGLVVTKDDHAGSHALAPFEVCETGHPVPDARGEAAARRVLELVASADPDDLLLVLLSGGASALVSLPPPGVSAEELAATNQLLLESGADIGEMNAVRKHLSQISGGRLARGAAASRIVVLAISDVAGDRLDVIGSGPCAPDPSRYADALEVLERRGLGQRVPRTVLEHLRRGREGDEPESPKPGEPDFARVEHRVVARNADARRAALAAAAALGARPISLGECIADEAACVGRRFAALSAAVMCSEPVFLVAGGESVVRVLGGGRGGRNQELALAAAIEFDRSATRGPVLLAAGTDGTDGPTDAAGAWADSETVKRGRSHGVDAARSLADNDSNTFYRAESGLVVTGPTGTNVMDLVLVWVPPRDDSATTSNIGADPSV